MMADSRSLESLERRREVDVENCLGQGLDKLNETQLSHLTVVVAEDNLMRSQLHSSLMTTLRTFQSIDQNYPVRSRSDCTFCHRKFGFLRRQVRCDCGRPICSGCQKNNRCPCCQAQLRVAYKEAEFAILCPWPAATFGLAKFRAFNTADLDHRTWLLYTRLELHFQHLFKRQLDAAKVDIRIRTDSLEEARHKLLLALFEFDDKTPFARVDTITKEIQSMIRTTPVTIEEDLDIPLDQIDYFNLLSNAIVSTVTDLRIANNTRCLQKVTSMDSYFNTTEVEDTFLSNDSINQSEVIKSQGNTEPNLSNGQVMQNKDNRTNGSLTKAMYEQPFFLKMKEENVVVRNGDVIQLECNLLGYHGYSHMLWFNAKKQLTDCGRIHIDLTEGRTQLNIFDSVTEDSGPVTCVAVVGGKVDVAVFNVTVEPEDIAVSRPEFVCDLKCSPYPPRIGQQLVLSCQVDGSPMPYVSFYKEGNVLCNSDEVEVSHANGIWFFKISRFTENDVGVYTASASNRCAKAFTQFNVNSSEERDCEVQIERRALKRKPTTPFRERNGSESPTFSINGSLNLDDV